MSTYPATGHTTFMGGYDFTGDSNKTTLTIEKDARDTSVFQPGVTLPGRRRIGGLEDVQSSVDLFWQAGSGQVDPAIIAALDGNAQVVMQTPNGQAGERAYFYQAGEYAYQMFGEVGEACPASLKLQGVRGSGSLSAGAIPGYLLKAKGTIAGTGATGSVVQVGAVGSTQFLYVALNTFAIGTSFTLQIQSDDNAGMSSPTTRVTVGSITGVGGTWATRLAGPITDDYWRVNVSALSGTSTIAVAIGIK